MAKMTGYVAPGAEKAFFFTEDRYVRYDVAADGVDEGWPRLIADDWPGVFEENIDAVVVWPDGSLFFFRGEEYIRYDAEGQAAAEGYPRPIAGNWPGLFESGVDAALPWPGGESVYFFSGSEYSRYDVATDATLEGYPRPIAGNWPGLFESGIEAAVLWPSGNAYFFRGDEYTKYDPEADAAAEGYPQPIADNWPGLPIGPIGSVPEPPPDGGGSAGRVRRDIWGLSEENVWHPIIEAYALGVAELQSRDASDPTGWRFQAAVHGLPPGEAGDAFRGQCQHFCWYFLPWHRLYLTYFERIVRAAIQTLPQIDDTIKQEWALPYWDYERSDDARALPPAFRERKLADGTTDNPLFVEDRKAGRNDGEKLPATGVSSAAARLPTTFSLDAPAGGFGGAATGWNHTDQDLNSFPGPLERTPHGAVHIEVGGLMSLFETAGLDPLFWLHHCNIDRLWEVWLGEGQGRANPPDGSDWYSALPFDFHDEAGQPVQNTCADAVDTADLGYTYENTQPPPPTRRARRRASMPSQPPEHPPELVGATEEPMHLTGGQESVSFGVGRPTGPAARRGAAKPDRVYLTVEGIEGDTQPGITYSVYVNLPDDDDPDADPETFYAGDLSFFGIERVGNVSTDRPGGHGLRHSFDITDIVEELDEQNRWNPDEVKVTFSPVGSSGAARRTRGGDAPAEAETPPVKLGRIGLYVQ